MSRALIDKIRKGRESRVESGGYTFTVRRPTDLEMLELGQAVPVSSLFKFVSGWNVKECDVVPGGGGDQVPFSQALFQEWIADRPDLWTDITQAIVEAYKAHETALGEAAKN
jgi:hypothetical protein